MTRSFLRMALLSLALLLAFICMGQRPHIKRADMSDARNVSVSKGLEELKLSPQLRALLSQFSKLPSKQRLNNDDRGDVVVDKQNRVKLYVELTERASTTDAVGLSPATVLQRTHDYAIVSIKLKDVPALAKLPAVNYLKVIQGGSVPIPPLPERSQAAKSFTELGEAGLQFNRQNLTGAGTIVAVVDGGIDFRHEDFLNAEGKTRLLYLWDVFDNSFSDSNGRIGSRPPANGADGKPLGTLYTREQIDSAIQGNGTVNSRDPYGHGTACMSTAAGSLSGIAPEADLIAINASKNGDGLIYNEYVLTLPWLTETASRLGEPLVLSLSFGGHWTGHDGSSAEEKLLDQSFPVDKSGVACCVSAGNEGRLIAHASTRFGPRTPENNEVDSEPIRVFCADTKRTTGGWLEAYFDSADDWTFEVQPDAASFTDEFGKPLNMSLIISKVGSGTKFKIVRADGEKASDKLIDKYMSSFVFGTTESHEDQLQVRIPAGNYWLWVYGEDANVTRGVVDVYAPRLRDVSFGFGGSKEKVVGSPGNSSNVITVGSYVARNSWANQKGGTTNLNLELGSISTYSSPGFRRDDVVKPDIAAPGQYLRSAFAAGSRMGNLDGQRFISPDGKYVYWDGTSASSPYVAGVIALMFQKNPMLTPSQIREILKRSAVADARTGPVPNRQWGYGRLDPEGAIGQTPDVNSPLLAHK